MLFVNENRNRKSVRAYARLNPELGIISGAVQSSLRRDGRTREWPIVFVT